MSRLSSLLDDPNGLKKVRRIFYGAIIFLLVLDVAFWAAGLNHSHLWLENLPLFGAAAGLVSAVLIVVLAKFLGRFLLTRKEDFYD